MKKRIKFIIFLIIIILLLIFGIVLIAGNQQKSIDRVINMYKNICKNENYTFSMEKENSEIKYKIVIAQKDIDTSINIYLNDDHSTTLILDKKAYYITHSNEEYYTIDSGDVDGDIIISGLKEIIDEPYENGEEEINGIKYYYEEYSNATTFQLLISAEDESTIKTRFYFDGDKIVYIKNISTEEDVEDELIKVNLEYSIDEDLFIIPDEYAEATNM